MKRGVRPRAPVPSGAGGAPSRVYTTQDNVGYDLYFTGSGAIFSDNPSGRSSVACDSNWELM